MTTENQPQSPAERLSAGSVLGANVGRNAPQQSAQGAARPQTLIELIDAYARTYHRWAKQPTNAELDAERRHLRQQIVETLAQAGDAIKAHLLRSHAAELAGVAALAKALADDGKILTKAEVIEWGPVLNPPHPDWKVTNVERIEP